MKNHYAQLAAMILGTTTVLAATPTTQPPSALAAQSQDKIQLEVTEKGFDLKLPTRKQSQQRPQLLSMSQGKVLVAELLNAQVDFAGRDRFRQNQPLPGVESVEVTQLDAERLRVVVIAENSVPAAEKLYAASEGAMTRLSFALSDEPPPPDQTTLAQLPSPNGSAQRPDILVPNPEVTIEDARPAPTPGNNFVPEGAPPVPVLPRAVAPPVGDIAVSGINSAPPTIDLGTSVRIPRLVLREAPVREVLSLLARSANLNVVYTSRGDDDQQDETERTISVDIEDESVQEAFNAILLLSGLQANRRGRTIFVGPQLPQAARNLITRTYRLNQVPASTAASFLATQGAATQQIFTPTQLITDPETQRVIREVVQPDRIVSVTPTREAQEAGTPLLLSGLSVSTDERLNSITLVGEPQKVQIATSMLTQLDARRRQVAVNVKIIDVNLLNTDNSNSSFSFGIGDSFFISDGGAAAVNFGGVNPPTSRQSTVPGTFPRIRPLPLPEGVEAEPFFDFQPNAPFGDSNVDVTPGAPEGSLPSSLYSRPNFGTEENPFQPGVSKVDEDGIEFTVPGLFEIPSRFLATLQAQIESGNAKVLTDPTLVVQEGQIASVNLTREVFSGVESRIEGGFFVESPIIRDAGLIVSISVDRIDDNGFITLNVNPTVSSLADTVDTGVAGQGQISLLQERNLTSGQIRLRDGQTLILTGIIQDSDRVSVSKVPILGDIPILGALFRSTNRVNERQEVIVLLTPRILDDSLRTGAGFNYTPGPEARQLLQERGFPFQNAPTP